ncbi:XRE family transcriptional regulator [Psychrobacillus sp. NEAU-3TGS]|uniref:helix-turn-helix domain-containing protein n=1 Tax=Psychrobacillus sp. NEAU-3TGS TaxID=2995412 RepID=UPI0024979552|nr:XRE family transcriptional regulator [Psychrobacillus sp. NEAU-3TGS]MDI2589459.1 XRE family transcriptional regulator [Psychrobacillus sp. NEAU-3TGS]
MGKKVKEARLNQSFTQQELAEKCNLTKSHISKIENGQAAPAVATLSKIAQELNAPLSWFLEANNQSKLSIVKNNEKKLRLGNKEIGYTYEALANRNQFSKIEPVVVTVLPEADLVEPFTHIEDEFIYILSGSINLYYDGELHFLEQGDSAYFEGNIPHIFLSADKNTEAKVLTLFIQGNAL